MNDDVIKGYQWICTLDELTCLDCLLLDGKMIKSTKPPLHTNCRCIAVPVTRTWKSMGIDLPEFQSGTRASFIGPVKEDGGIYKQYLIERATLLKSNSNINPSCLLDILMNLKHKYPNESSEYNLIQMNIINKNIDIFEKDKLIEVLNNTNSITNNYAYFIANCYCLGLIDEVNNKLNNLIEKSKTYSFSNQKLSTYFLLINTFIKKHTAEDSYDILKMAFDVYPSEATGVKLSKLNKKYKNYNEAKLIVVKALEKYPDSKSLIKELEMLNKKV